MTHLREVLGDETYESLANAGGNMTTAAMAAYAFVQIDQGCVRPSRASASLSPRLLGDGAELATYRRLRLSNYQSVRNKYF